MSKIDHEMQEMAEVLEKAAKTGEGSRGGKIIGHTRSGKPIYDTRSAAARKRVISSDQETIDREGVEKEHAHHGDYSLEDHIDAAAFHGVQKRSATDEKVRNKHDAGANYHDHAIGKLTNGHQYTDEHKAMGAKAVEHYQGQAQDRERHLNNKFSSLDETKKREKPSHAEMMEAGDYAHMRGQEAHEWHAHHAEKKGDAEGLDYHKKMYNLHGLYRGDGKKSEGFMSEAKKRHSEMEGKAPKNPGDSVREANAGSHVQALNQKAAEMHASGKISKDEHDAIVKENNKGYEKRMKKGFESLVETVMEMGPEAIRKAIPTLSDSQKALLSEVLAKAKEVPKAAMGSTDGQELIEVATEKKKMKKRPTQEGEELVDESITDVNHQGDDSEKNGQIIKSETAPVAELTDEERAEKMKRMVGRMKERRMEKSACIAQAEKVGNTELAKAISEQWGEEAIEKALPAQEEKKSAVVVEVKKEGEDEEEEKAPKVVAAPPVAKEEPVMKKSIQWSEGTQALLKASTRRGQNAHYTVEDDLLKTEEKNAEIIAKGGYLNETGETLAKSQGEKKVSVNDILEKGLDMADLQLQDAQRLAKAEPRGAFNVRSFSDAELAASMGLDPSLVDEILGKKK